MKSAGKARNNGLYRHIRTSKEIIRNLLNDCCNFSRYWLDILNLYLPFEWEYDMIFSESVTETEFLF